MGLDPNATEGENAGRAAAFQDAVLDEIEDIRNETGKFPDSETVLRIADRLLLEDENLRRGGGGGGDTPANDLERDLGKDYATIYAKAKETGELPDGLMEKVEADLAGGDGERFARAANLMTRLAGDAFGEDGAEKMNAYISESFGGTAEGPGSASPSHWAGLKDRLGKDFRLAGNRKVEGAGTDAPAGSDEYVPEVPIAGGGSYTRRKSDTPKETPVTISDRLDQIGDKALRMVKSIIGPHAYQALMDLKELSKELSPLADAEDAADAMTEIKEGLKTGDPARVNHGVLSLMLATLATTVPGRGKHYKEAGKGISEAARKAGKGGTKQPPTGKAGPAARIEVPKPVYPLGPKKGSKSLDKKFSEWYRKEGHAKAKRYEEDRLYIPGKSESGIWKLLGKARKDGKKVNGRGQAFRWDRQHGHIEVINTSTNKHIGVMNPFTGKMMQGPKRGRTDKVSLNDGSGTTFV